MTLYEFKHYHLFQENLPSNCPVNFFTCSNKKCRSPAAMCDGIDDCGDNSDESIGCNGMLTLNPIWLGGLIKY